MNVFLRMFLNHLFRFTTLFFAAAAVVPEVGGTDAPEGAADSGDAPTTDGGADEAASAAVDTPADGKPVDAKVEGKVDGKLPQPIRELMKELQAKDAKAHGFLKDVLYRDRTFKQELPGGLAELKQLKETVAALPEGGIQAIKAEKAEWDSIDEAYNAADPKFLEIMVDANPESFNKLAPAMIGKFAQTDPEGYQRHMAGLFVSTLVNNGVPQSLRFLSRAVEMGDKDNAGAIIKELNDMIQGWDATSKTQPKAPERNTELDAREQKIKEAEDKQWVENTASKVNSYKTSAIKKELAQHAKGQQIDDETYEAIEGQALKYLNGLLMADPSFAKTFNAYCEAKDTDGINKFMSSKLDELLPSKAGKPGPVEKAYKLFFRGATTTPKPKPTAPGAKPVPATPAGWVKVGKAPAPSEIDLGKSPWEMRFKQAAILKGGKKVFWGANAPA